MLISTLLAQTPVTWNVCANLATIADVLTQARPGDVVVLPEGALSGYGADLRPVRTLDPEQLARAIEEVDQLARRREARVFCGTLLPEADGWHNAALLLGAGERATYRKINLAMNERGPLRAGDSLPVFEMDGWTAGVQLCREIRFPEQWQHLARSGAQVLAYLTNAANPDEPAGVWRSHLISRAAENQRFVLSANLADPLQHCPTMAISPRGEVLGELPPGEPGVLRVTLDLNQVSDWYLGQQRSDLFSLRYHR